MTDIRYITASVSPISTYMKLIRATAALIGDTIATLTTAGPIGGYLWEGSHPTGEQRPRALDAGAAPERGEDVVGRRHARGKNRFAQSVFGGLYR